MALADMKVFNDFMYSAATETIRQQIELFNEATSGALRLQQVGNVGDFAHEATYRAIGNLMRRRNAYGTGAIAATTLGQMEHVAVKSPAVLLRSSSSHSNSLGFSAALKKLAW
tara:strand:- start:488 stop:826 length:339 start_codon:yes stop_codon:yes gene_type:complete